VAKWNKINFSYCGGVFRLKVNNLLITCSIGTDLVSPKFMGAQSMNSAGNMSSKKIK
jgi:hypothetical protein